VNVTHRQSVEHHNDSLRCWNSDLVIALCVILAMTTSIIRVGSTIHVRNTSTFSRTLSDSFFSSLVLTSSPLSGRELVE
jgi:hypothetical protein